MKDLTAQQELLKELEETKRLYKRGIITAKEAFDSFKPFSLLTSDGSVDYVLLSGWSDFISTLPGYSI